MPHSVHTITTAEALQRVFLPAVRPLPKTSLYVRRKPLHPLNTPARHASTRWQAGAFDLSGKFVSSAKFGPKLSSTNPHPQDEAINALNVHIVQADERLSRPQSLLGLLRRINRKTHLIEQHSKFQGIPVCRVVDKAEARAAEKQRRKAKAKSPEQTKKYLELNWAIDQNDLQHRLAKLRQFLTEGRRVEVFLAKKKKRMRDATQAEGRETLKKIKECVEGVDGAKELKAMEGAFLQRATLFYEGKRAKPQAEKADKGDEADRSETEIAKVYTEKDIVQEEEEEESVEQEERPRRAAFG
ncbi:MAG: hypothetical protein Q9195_002355 [Heterodermia aff. obscurata]